jgi:hypothetical protein
MVPRTWMMASAARCFNSGGPFSEGLALAVLDPTPTSRAHGIPKRALQRGRAPHGCRHLRRPQAHSSFGPPVVSGAHVHALVPAQTPASRDERPSQTTFGRRPLGTNLDRLVWRSRHCSFAMAKRASRMPEHERALVVRSGSVAPVGSDARLATEAVTLAQRSPPNPVRLKPWFRRSLARARSGWRSGGPAPRATQRPARLRGRAGRARCSAGRAIRMDPFESALDRGFGPYNGPLAGATIDQAAEITVRSWPPRYAGSRAGPRARRVVPSASTELRKGVKAHARCGGGSC